HVCRCLAPRRVAPPQAAHSSPTRRSSDLGRGVLDVRPHRVVEVALVRVVHAAVLVKQYAALLPVLRALRPPGLPLIDVRAGRVEDRKSTRLNSSHVKISYAVFCLKNKDLL